MSTDQKVPTPPWWIRFCRWLWAQREVFWGTMILGVVLNVFATWLIFPSGQGFAGTRLGIFLGNPWMYLPIGICLLLFTALVGLLGRKSSSLSISSTSLLALSSKNRLALWQMLSKEYSRQLGQTLPGATMLPLNLHERTDLTRSPTQLVFRRKNEEHPLPPDTSIAHVYDAAGQGLLILGEPGAGKTTLLLDLAQELLRRAETDESHPIPFILNISSWGNTRSALSIWLIEELSRAYDIPKVLGTTLLHSDQILFLLDGLDEVTPTARTACVEAINVYKGTHFRPLVICSRSREYREQPARLTVPTAVVVQPLSPEQVMTYLKRLGKPLSAVRAILQTNPVLAQLLTTPLLLNVVILAYRDKTVKDLPQLGTAEEQQKEIFHRYVIRMLEQRGEPMSYSQEQIRHWLGWLAKHMHESSQSIHYIEHLQPDWLTPHQKPWYTWLGKYIPGILIGILTNVSLTILLFGFSIPERLIDGVLGGLCGGLLLASLAVSHISYLSPMVKWRTSTRQSVFLLLLGAGIGWLIFLSTHNYFIALASGICYGLGSLLLSFILLWQQRQASLLPAHGSASKMHPFVQATGIHLRRGLWIGMIIGLTTGVYYYGRPSFNLNEELHNGLTYGLSYGFLGGALSFLLRTGLERVQPKEIIVWSGPRLLKILISPSHLLVTLLISSLFFVVSIESISRPNYGLSFGPSTGLSFGLCYWCLGGIYRSVSSKTFEEHHRIAPNQGIRRSGRNGLILGSLCGIFAAMLAILDKLLLYGLTAPNPVDFGRGVHDTLSLHLSDSIAAGLSVAFLAGLLFGGLAYFQHYVLRWLLRREGVMPWRDPQFLEDAVKHVLLKRVGGGYSFIHPLFQEYFANADSLKSSHVPTVSSSPP